jgi:formate dehydrogenase iron-sulfur subunit
MTRQVINLDEPCTTAQAPEATGGISRRAFVKRLGLGAAAIASCAVLEGAPAAAASSDGADNEEAIGVLIDLTRCSGCQSCALACKVSNAMPLPEEVPTGLSSGALCFVDTRPESDGAEVYVKRQCMHCLHPACVSACTVGALRKTALGPVVYDADKCIGCRYCQYACPFGVPTYQWENPLGLIHKCELCFDRVTEGELPACVAACPNGALRFGKRTELLAQAKAQIASRPERYIDHIFGEHEVGGTSMLYLSDVPFARLGFPALEDRAVSGYAETVMGLTPAVAAAVATLATGLHMIFRRRQQALEFKLQDAQPQAAAHRAQQKEEQL